MLPGKSAVVHLRLALGPLFRLPSSQRERAGSGIFDMKKFIRFFRFFPVAGAIVTLPLTPALADVKAGVDAWSAGNYEAAVNEWKPLAAAGDPDATFNLPQA